MDDGIEITPFGEVNYNKLREHAYTQNIKDDDIKRLHESYWEQYKKQVQRFKEKANSKKPEQTGGSSSSNKRIKTYAHLLKTAKDQCIL